MNDAGVSATSPIAGSSIWTGWSAPQYPLRGRGRLDDFLKCSARYPIAGELLAEQETIYKNAVVLHDHVRVARSSRSHKLSSERQVFQSERATSGDGWATSPSSLHRGYARGNSIFQSDYGALSAASERGNRLFRFLDLWAGTPLCAVCGITRRAAGPPPAITRIGLLRTAAIGDTVLLSGPVADLRQSFLESSITLFCGGSNFEVARLVPGLDDVVRLPITRLWKALSIVRRAGLFDAWIDFGQWPRYDALVSHFARAAFKVGFRTPGQRRHYVFDRCAAHTTDRHEIENFRALTAVLGASGGSLPCLLVPEGERPLAPGSVVFHMFPGGSRAAVKAWPAERWVELAARVAAAGHRVVLTGSGRDRAGAEAVAARISDGAAAVAAGELDIAATARLLQGLPPL